MCKTEISRPNLCFHLRHMNLAWPVLEITMLLLCHALVVAIIQIFIISENQAFAKNINFYNVRPPLDRK